MRLCDSYQLVFEMPDGAFKMYHRMEEGVVIMRPRGDADASVARRMFAYHIEIKDQLGYPYPCLLDMTEMGTLTVEARSIMSGLLLNAESPFTRFATVEGSFFNRTMMKLYGKLCRFPMRIFKNREDAMRWLKEE